MKCPKCGLENPDIAERCDCGYDFASGEMKRSYLTAAQKPAQEGMFRETDYVPFMLGVFLIGGLIAVPLTYGAATGLGYFESLPWALGSCVVFLVAFRRNGTISWSRAIPAFGALMIGAGIYHESTGKPAFAVGGLLGFLLVVVCGYVGLGIGRMFKT